MIRLITGLMKGNNHEGDEERRWQAMRLQRE
jgi:hypothetical protein